MNNPFKNLLLIGSLLITALWTTAQPEYERADSIALNLSGSFDNVGELAQKLTASLTSDKEKARAIFMWVADNVRYDCHKFHNPTKTKFSATTKEGLEEAKENYKKEQAQKTMKNKKGVCADYSQLYKALCDEAGLEAVVVTGNARDFHKPYRNAHDNPHAWNAVKIQDKWYLLDVTWGAGYTDAAVKKFTRKIAAGFFFPPAEWFSQNHFPDDEKWQLLDEPLSKKAFADQPVLNYGQTKYRITDFAPQATDVAGKKNEKEIWFRFEDAPKELMVATMNGKQIQFNRTDIDGKVVLSFSGSAARSIAVFGGDSLRKSMGWLAMYQL